MLLLACGSRSIRSVLRPRIARAAARFTAVVVLSDASLLIGDGHDLRARPETRSREAVSLQATRLVGLSRMAGDWDTRSQFRERRCAHCRDGPKSYQPTGTLGPSRFLSLPLNRPSILHVVSMWFA